MDHIGGGTATKQRYLSRPLCSSRQERKEIIVYYYKPLSSLRLCERILFNKI